MGLRLQSDCSPCLVSQTYVSFGFQKAGVELNIKTLEFDGRRVRTELSDYSGFASCTKSFLLRDKFVPGTRHRML